MQDKLEWFEEAIIEKMAESYAAVPMAWSGGVKMAELIYDLFPRRLCSRARILGEDGEDGAAIARLLMQECDAEPYGNEVYCETPPLATEDPSISTNGCEE